MNSKLRFVAFAFPLVLYTLITAISNAVYAVNIPDPSRDRAFLYNSWLPNRANVVAFLDPLCPYCKKAIPRLNQITDYNLFVYWVPIFGQRSEDVIGPFFQCEKPTGRDILLGLTLTPDFSQAQEQVTCSEGSNSSSRVINDEMAASYPINGVPAFFLQGVEVSLAQIQSIALEPANYTNGVAIDWMRYKESQVKQTGSGDSLAIIFPQDQDAKLILQLLQYYRPEYLFFPGNWETFCEAQPLVPCLVGEEVRGTRLRQYNEIVALLDVQNHSGEIYLITKDGDLSDITTYGISEEK